MHTTRFDSAPVYDAPGHTDMQMRRIQGREAGPGDTLWIGVSMIAPGGGTTLSASSAEKFYVVLEGELTVTTRPHLHEESVVLARHDSCRIAPGESRRLLNRGGHPCTVLLVMANR